MTETPSPDDAERIYSATAVVQWPTNRSTPAVVGEEVRYESRIIPQNCNVLGFEFRLMPYPFKEMALPPPGQNFTSEPAALKAMVSAPTMASAATSLREPLFTVLDDLAFQLQMPMPVQRLDLIDITAPVSIGDVRQSCTYSGFDPYRHVRSAGFLEFEIAKYPGLRNLSAPMDPKIRASLDWYMKGLVADNDPDRFIFFWIAFEVMSRLSTIKIEEPTLLRCHHSVPFCPVCNKSTVAYRQGETKKAILQDFGLTEQQADSMWKLRQIVHGARNYVSEQTSELNRGVLLIRNAIFGALKKALQWHPESLPRATGQRMSLRIPSQIVTCHAVREWELA